MGKATILSSLGDGKYRVTVNYDRSRAEAQISALTADIAAVDAELPDLQSAINSALLDLDFSQEVLDAAVHAYQQDPTPENKTTVETVQGGVREAQGQLRNARQAKSLAELRKTQAQKRIEFLQANMPADREAEAWCADYTEDLTGEVGTVEVGRVDLASPILLPAGETGDGSRYDTDRDGQLQSVMSGTPASAFWNYAMLPGSGKHRPRYRLGEITSLDSAQGVADVALDDAASTHQSLDINPSGVLADVPIQYLDCHAQAFEVGDRVVVEFQSQDWSQPRIIGFEREPRECYLTGLLCRTADGRFVHLAWSDGWTAKEKTMLGGNIDWRAADGEVVTWRGAASRYWANQVMGTTPGVVYHLVPGLVFFTDTTFPAHYVIERVLQPLPEGQTLGSVGSIEAYAETSPLYDGRIFSRGKAYDMGGWVMGAARQGNKLLFVRATPDSQAQNASEQVCIYDLSTEATTVLGSRSWSVEFPSSGQPAVPHNMTPWLINASATEAIAVRTVEVSGVLEAHKFRLFVNWETLSASWQDEGRAQETEIDKTTAISYEGVFGVSGGGYRHYGSQDVSQTDRIWFWDWDGDTEISGEIKVESTIYTYGEQRQDPPVDGGDPFLWEERIYNELEAAQLTITMRGVQVYSGQIGHSDTAKLAQGYPDMEEDESHITHAGSLTGEMIVAYADLRSGLIELEARTGESYGYATERVGLDMFSGLYYAAGFTVDDGGESRWLWQITGPGISAQDTGTPWTFTQNAAEPLNPVADQSQYDFDFGVSENTTAGTGQFGYIPGRVRCGGSSAIMGRAAAEPGDTSRLFISAPIGLGALLADWDHDAPGFFHHLTGGDPAQLTGQQAGGARYAPIVVV